MKEWIKNVKKAIADRTFALHYLDKCEQTITDLIAEIERLEAENAELRAVMEEIGLRLGEFGNIPADDLIKKIHNTLAAAAGKGE